jgi:hypothetical protein
MATVAEGLERIGHAQDGNEAALSPAPRRSAVPRSQSGPRLYHRPQKRPYGELELMTAPAQWVSREPPTMEVDEFLVLDRSRPDDSATLRRLDADPDAARFFGWTVELVLTAPASHYDGNRRAEENLAEWREGRRLCPTRCTPRSRERRSLPRQRRCCAGRPGSLRPTASLLRPGSTWPRARPA